MLASVRGNTLLSRREVLRLGADIEQHGEIPDEKIERTAAVVSAFVAEARAVGAAAIEVLIASPGRQASNGTELAARLEQASGCPTRILSSIEEGRLAFVGALSSTHGPGGRTVAVVDVGGGSAQIVVGSRKEGPVWSHSIDLGSQRLTSRLLSDDPPGPGAMRAARAEVDRYLDGLEPPVPRSTFAVGGTARALKRLAGGQIGAAQLEDALAQLASTSSAELARRDGIREERARTLPAGAAIFAGIQRLLGTPLKVQRGGLREGALLALADERSLAA